MDNYQSDQIIEDQAATIRQLTMMLSEATSTISLVRNTISGLEYSNETLEKDISTLEKENANIRAENDRLRVQVNTTARGYISQASALQSLENIVRYQNEGVIPKISLIKALRNMTGIGLKEAKDAIEAGDFYFNKGGI